MKRWLIFNIKICSSWLWWSSESK